MAARVTCARTARSWHASIAVLVLVGLVVQIWIAAGVSGTPPAHAVGTLAGAPAWQRILRVLSFFTVQSNILAGISSAQLARNPDRDGRSWRAVRLASLLGITVTGVVYSTVLAKIHEPNGWKETFTNDVFHYAVPIAMVVGWLLFGPRPRIDARSIGLATVWPVAWFGYTLIHGAISGWYPYHFIDVGDLGYPHALLNALVVTMLLGVVLSVIWMVDQRANSLTGRGVRRRGRRPVSRGQARG
jgi:hypothetical protein